MSSKSFTHNPRRSNGFTTTTPSCRKGSTFHSPTPTESSSYFTPPSLPRRSQTSLEDVVDEKKRRAALALEDFDRKHGASPSTSPTVQSYRDEGLPFPQGLLQNTIQSASTGDYSEAMDYKFQLPHINERKASLRPQRQTRRTQVSDSGLGSSIQTKSSSVGGVASAITMSVAPGSSVNLQRMSEHASKVVNRHILQKLLAERSFKDFHPILRDCPRAIDQSEIVCVRDLEKTLTLGAPDLAKTADLYLQFCTSAILCIRTALTVGNLSSSEQTRPQDRPYSPGYFTDLVAQVRQAALQIAASREREAQGEKLTELDAKASDEIKLHGGLAVNGRPAELVRMKNGTAISVATGEPVVMDEAKSHPMKRSLSEDEDDEVYRSMARRKKCASAAELAPKRCSIDGCEKEFKRPCDLTKHEKTHTRPWKCAVRDCRYSKEGWPTEKELLRHQNDRHSQAPKMFACEYEGCTYQSKRDSNRKQHMEKAHGYNYVRTKSNGRKKASGSVQASTPLSTGVQTPNEQPNDDFENQTNGSPNYEQSVYSPDGFGDQSNENSAYSPDEFADQTSENSAYSPDYAAVQNLSPYLEDDLDMDMEMEMDIDMNVDVPHLFHPGNYMDSPNSNLRHGSTDSSVPSPYGGDILSGFHLATSNGAFPVHPANDGFDYDFQLFNDAAHHMQIPEPSVYQRQLPEFTSSSCGSNQMQRISPGGHGNHVLYTPPSLQAVDEGFEEYSSGEDFALFSSNTTNASHIPLFGEISPSNTTNTSSNIPVFGELNTQNDMYPSFFSTPECMNFDPNSIL